MVNHIRTLLLNESAGDVNVQGSRFVVDTGFTSVDAGGYLSSIRASMLSGCSDLVDMESVVDGLFKLACRPDLSAVVGFFDGRCTPVLDGSKVTDRARSAFFSRSTKSILFKITGVKSVDDVVTRLDSLDSASSDGELRLAVRVLAYALQIEARRLGNAQS